MGQVQAGMIILLVIIFLFLPISYIQRINNENHDIKQHLNLSARVVSNCIEAENINSRDISLGYARDVLTPVKIDKDKLLTEFYDVLYKNVGSSDLFKSIKSKMLLKVLVYYDQFYVAGVDDQWGIPYYFTFETGDDIIYLYNNSNIVRYFDVAGNTRTDKTIADFGLTPVQKNQIIINKINSIISKFTSEKVIRDNGLKVEIYNPENKDPAYMANYQNYFNVLDGITFFVVYAENTNINVNRTDFKYINYNIVGYTVR